MANNLNCSGKRLKRQYLTDVNKTIPKQSRRKWLQNDIVPSATDTVSLASNVCQPELVQRGQSSTSTVNNVLVTSLVNCSPTPSVADRVVSFQSKEALVNKGDALGCQSDYEDLSFDDDDGGGYDFLESEYACFTDASHSSDSAEAAMSENDVEDTQLPVDNTDDCTVPSDELRIPGGDEPIHPGSPITKGQAAVMLMSFILRHNLTNTAVDDLLDLLAILSPSCLPASRFLLTKGLFAAENNLERHMYCNCCQSYVAEYSQSQDIKKCKYCDASFNRDLCIKEGQFFLYMPVEKQLQQLLSKHQLLLKSDAVQHDVLDSVLNGKVMKTHLLSHNVLDCDVTLMWNSDGAPVFSSSKRSIWPLQVCVNELPPTCKDNLVLVGLWFGHLKPTAHCYLKPFVEELKQLGTRGMCYVNSNKETVMCKVYAMCCSTDSCARPMLKSTVQFNGRFGCDWCLNEGKVVERGDGNCRIYLPPEGSLQLRTKAAFINDALKATADNAVNGVKGVSPVVFMPQFDIVTGFVPDYLHCVLLGVVRTISGLWFDSTNHTKPWYIKPSRVAQIDRQLLTLKPPSDISRLPRALGERKFWKGSEWKSFLLYYSLIVLPGTLAAKFINHWFMLVFSVHILLQDSITQEDVVMAEKVLVEFVSLVPSLYGAEFCSFNVHQLLHLPEAVRNWGPLWVFSCFRFENNIGQILTLVRGSKCVPKQIFRSFLTRTMLPSLFDRYCTVLDMHVDTLMQRLWCSGIYIRKTKVTAGDVHLYGRPIIRTLTLSESLAYNRARNATARNVSYSIYERFSYKSLYITSSYYKPSNRHCDDTIQLTDRSFATIVCCAVGIFSCCCNGFCVCVDSVAIFVKTQNQIADNNVFRNARLGIASSRFMAAAKNTTAVSCILPEVIFRKCFRYPKKDFNLIVPLPTRNETD